MHRSESRCSISAIAFFALVFQALLSPGTAGPPAVNLTALLAAEAASTATAAASEGGSADDAFAAAARSRHPSPAANGGIPYCPYFSCAFDLAHAAGLLPAPGLPPAVPPIAAHHEAPRAFDLAHPRAALAANRVRGPPSLT